MEQPPVEQEQELTQEQLSELLQIRRDKLSALQAAGRDPFANTTYDVSHYSSDIISAGAPAEGELVTVSIAGRMVSRRIMGKASFAHLLDARGRIQVYMKRDDLGEEAYDAFKTFDIGDIIGVKGFVFTTRTGEISVHAQEVTLLSKSLRPLPEKYHGLKDAELRYRQRFVDLIVNPEVRDMFQKRSRIISEIRRRMDERGFIEVETPVLNTTASGASARPFVTHHNTLDLDMYLRIATELHLKECVVGGLERVYEIGRLFRNEGMDAMHNPEFTTIEAYQAYTDYNGNLSGGNQQKVLLAKWMFAEPDILILDEPTRGIDVGAKYEIYCIINDLVAAGKSVIMISSEMPEVLGMCDRIYVMSEAKIVGEMDAQDATQELIMSSILSVNKGA